MTPPNLQLDHAAHRPCPRPLALRVLAHDLELAANVGALFRIADALGVEHLHLSGRTPVPPDARIRRAARSADRVVPFSQGDDPLATVAVLKADGWRVVALELSTASIDVRTLPVASDDRVCLVLGAEAEGVSQALLDAADATVHLPMRGQNSSMNVASACAIALWEIGGKLAGGTA
jgi:tRNA G18 (ribose-2'-O)-methylase SpoU